MRTTIELLDAVKAKSGAPSDYACKDILHVTRQQISNYRRGKEFFSDDVCIRVAEILDVAPLLVLATVHAERTRSEPAKKAWIDIIDKFGGTAAAAAVAVMLSALPPLQPSAHANTGASSFSPNYTLCATKRRRRRGVLSNMVEQLLARPRLA